MNRKTTSIIAGLLCTFLVSIATIKAQQPSPSPKKDTADNSTVQAGEDAGGYNIISSIEFGYRGKSIDGDINKYKSDLNYTAGPRLFDSTFLMVHLAIIVTGASASPMPTEPTELQTSGIDFSDFKHAIQ